MMSRSVCIVVLSLVGVALSQVTVPAPISPFGPRPIYPGAAGIYPGVQGPFVPILQQNYDLNPDGSYNFGYQSADGSSRREEGQVRFPGAPVAPVQGNYAYISPEGANIEVSYVADENGYQPSGPGIHPAILRAVAYQVAQARAENAQYPNGPIPIGAATPIPPVYPYPTPIQPLRAARSVSKASH